MKKQIVFGLCLVVSIFYQGLGFAETKKGFRIKNLNIDSHSKSLSITVCNWDHRDLDVGGYRLVVKVGDWQTERVFESGYVLNYACTRESFSLKDRLTEQFDDFMIEVSLVSPSGQTKDEEKRKIDAPPRKRFIPVKFPKTDIYIKESGFDEEKQSVFAVICTRGDNYRVSPKYYLSTKFQYNNYYRKTFYGNKRILSGTCWKTEMPISKLRILKPGTYRVDIFADSGNAVEEKLKTGEESDGEDNNWDDVSFTVKKPETKKKNIAKEDKKKYKRLFFYRRMIKKHKSKRRVVRRKSLRRSLNLKKRRISPQNYVVDRKNLWRFNVPVRQKRRHRISR